MRAWTSPIQAWKSLASIVTGLGRLGGRKVLEDLAFQHSDLLLRRLEPFLAKPRELQPALVRGQRLLERKVAAFHAADELLQLIERLFESQGARSGTGVVRGTLTRGTTHSG